VGANPTAHTNHTIGDRVVKVGSWPRRVLDAVGLVGRVPVYDDIDAALAALGG
jgi:hypothetical protein